MSTKPDEGKLSEGTIMDIEQSLEDAKADRTLSMKEVKERFKLNDDFF
ncbi:hypothetical protein NTE_00689 [Candidatus Nitrososphaera evergladensis SR1]|uniref:Uncharacterized protein n=1 Tax=Candidatus Nitrososphaera evergladensis SR1 TaxID=1459636 RepID=A0A075MU18_9ARCH|nr:hypothetical protein [Candidatus Nitrososphaera evergladensis]AIF82769.1 hypothetical protein NTE_00689 [Candidatus Nitrososphaera evergladensis SR1]